MIEIDVTGKSCPHPLIAMRKAIMSANDGDAILIHGDHPPSREEIPMGAEAMGCEIIDNTIGENNIWTIKILVKKDKNNING